MGPQRYRVRAAEVDALEWTGGNVAEMEAFAGPAFSYYEGEASLLGNPGGAWHPLDVGNYAVKGVTGEFFIIFGEDFADNYESITPATTSEQVLACPMRKNDADAVTVGDYLIKLLALVWQDGEGFDGKRPFGNSSWEYEIFEALADAGLIWVAWDEDDSIEDFDRDAAEKLVADAIEAIGASLNRAEASS
jgi:hypothetical protein